MEDVEAPRAPLQALPPAPTRRGAGAATLRGLHALAAEAVPCCYHASLWALGATNAVLIAARRAFGRDSRTAAVAMELLWVAFLAAALLRFAVLLLRWSVLQTRRDEAAREIGGGGADAEAQRRRASAYLAGYCGLFTALTVASVGALMQMLAPTRESYQRRVGSMITDIGCFLYYVTFCFISGPELLIELRATYAKLKPGMAGLPRDLDP